jgi:hypothetical protein
LKKLNIITKAEAEDGLRGSWRKGKENILVDVSKLAGFWKK